MTASNLSHLLLLLLALVVGSEDASPKPRSVELAEAQIEWLRSKGGYYSPKLSMEPLFESESPQVPLGMFARESVVKGEKLMVIPRRCLLTAGESMDDCDTAVNLVHERELKEKSDFAPYVDYLYFKEKILLPSNWSPLGQKLIRKIRGKRLPPEDLTEVSFENHCGEWYDTTDELEFAYLSTVSRAWSDKLVPVFDMINHHSGRFANVDSTPVHGPNDVSVYATRDIAAGEQLYLSYMDCIDEKGFENEYVLPQMLRDFGFVDQYPQRWIFPGEVDDPGEGLVFDVDFARPEGGTQPKGGQAMTLTWRTEEPSPKQQGFLKKQLGRLQSIKPYVTQVANQLESNYEKEVSLTYYRSMTVALEYALGMNSTNHQGLCDSKDFGEVCLSEAGVKSPSANWADDADQSADDSQSKDSYPKVSKRSSKLADDDIQPTGSDPDEWMACENFWRIEDDFMALDSYMTNYQEVDVVYHEEEDDACLYLDGYLHTCASSRPHYHEVFVHYAARFVDQVKRVLFIGGGDSKVLHEVLKYPSLELVVGLELDQLVVRTSFKTFGTSPHWDSEKVEWYFGDAARSLSVLPRSYYGSFDLVVVDILTEVADSLKVNQELTMLDAAMLLMKPDGIIIKNEDQGYVPGSTNHRSNYAVDLVFHDVPHYCLQVFVAVSNSVDFLTAEPKDHQVDTLYLKGMDEFESQFDTWYNFGVSKGADKCSENKANQPNDPGPPLGVLMILEAEDTAIALESSAQVAGVIDQALANAGLSQVDSLTVPLTVNGAKGFSTVVLAKEGHVAARCIPSLEYCAFDIQLYGEDIEKLTAVKTELVSAVQSQHPSIYRFVTGGMFGGQRTKESRVGPPSAEDLCMSETNNSQEILRPKKFRREKGMREFDKPKPVSLHSYDKEMPLKQWESQSPVGTQILVEFEAPAFWKGEKVLILVWAEDSEDWVEGSIRDIRSTGKYDVVYGRTFEKRVVEGRIKRAPEQTDKEIVKSGLLQIAKLVWKFAEQEGDLEDSEAKILSSGIGDGLTLAVAWDEGTLVISWDGRRTVTCNLFLSPATYDLIGVIDDVIHAKPVLSLVTRDDFPRGIGAVVNFEEELNGELPIWA